MFNHYRNTKCAGARVLCARSAKWMDVYVANALQSGVAASLKRHLEALDGEYERRVKAHIYSGGPGEMNTAEHLSYGTKGLSWISFPHLYQGFSVPASKPGQLIKTINDLLLFLFCIKPRCVSLASEALSLCLSLSQPLYLSLSLSRSLCFAVSLSLGLCLSLFLFVCLAPCVFTCPTRELDRLRASRPRQVEISQRLPPLLLPHHYFLITQRRRAGRN